MQLSNTAHATFMETLLSNYCTKPVDRQYFAAIYFTMNIINLMISPSPPVIPGIRIKVTDYHRSHSISEDTDENTCYWTALPATQLQ